MANDSDGGDNSGSFLRTCDTLSSLTASNTFKSSGPLRARDTHTTQLESYTSVGKQARTSQPLDSWRCKLVMLVVSVLMSVAVAALLIVDMIVRCQVAVT